MNFSRDQRYMRFFRTAGDAFRDATYASAIELPPPSFWQRVWSLLWR